jgi:sulfur-oxidizing protein SoxX
MNSARNLIAVAVMAGSLAASTAWAETAPGDVKFEDGEVAMSVSGNAGDAANGAGVFKNKKLGNCLACHANSDMKNELFHGEVGPSLDGVADRYSVDQLRAIVANSKEVFGDQTVMPGFYTLNVGKNPAKEFVGKTILSAQDVEDVVAYLATLKE